MDLHNNPTLKIGLALSGGQLKAAAHIGVLRALHEMGITPTCIAGTSAGSLVSALYAHGYRHEELTHILENFRLSRILDYGFPIVTALSSWFNRHYSPANPHKMPKIPRGILRGKKYISFIDELLIGKSVSTPYFVVATDLKTGHPVLFHSEQHVTLRTESVWIENAAKVIAGSCAIPGIFTPVELGPYQLVDGGFRDYVPVSVLRSYGCNKIIAVNLYHLPEEYKIQSLVDVILRSIDILLRESVDNDLSAQRGDVFVIEPDLSSLEWKSLKEMKTCDILGYQEAFLHRESLQSFLTTPPRIKNLNGQPLLTRKNLPNWEVR